MPPRDNPGCLRHLVVGVCFLIIGGVLMYIAIDAAMRGLG